MTKPNHPVRREPAAEKRRALNYATRTAAKVESSEHERDAAIRFASAAGASLREIADATGLSHTHVKRTIDRLAAADH